jgi:hypothetical protein
MSLIGTSNVPTPSNVQSVRCYPKHQVLTLPEKPLALQEYYFKWTKFLQYYEIQTGESLKAKLIFVSYTTCDIHANSHIPL